MRATRQQKGYRVGESHQRAKLSDAEVRAMRAMHLPYVRGYETLARIFGCGVSTARDICTRRTRWAC